MKPGWWTTIRLKYLNFECKSTGHIHSQVRASKINACEITSHVLFCLKKCFLYCYIYRKSHLWEIKLLFRFEILVWDTIPKYFKQNYRNQTFFVFYHIYPPYFTIPMLSNIIQYPDTSFEKKWKCFFAFVDNRTKLWTAGKGNSFLRHFSLLANFVGNFKKRMTSKNLPI